jgi:hypothetical protein
MWYTILIVLVLDLGGLILVYVLLRDRVRRATSVESQVAEVREEVSRLLVELNQTTDRNIALIEDRIARLNESLAAADKKIGLLRREIEKHDVGAQIYSRLAEGRPRGTTADAGMPPGAAAGARGGESADQQPVAARMPQPRQSRQSRQEREEMPQPRQEREGVAAEREAVAAGPVRAPLPPLAVELSTMTEARSGRRRDELRVEPGREEEGPDLHQRVMTLHRAGFSPALIASRVGVPLGEVELIISLEQRKGQV